MWNIKRLKDIQCNIGLYKIYSQKCRYNKKKKNIYNTISHYEWPNKLNFHWTSGNCHLCVHLYTFAVCTVGKVYKMSDKLVISPPSNFEHTVHVGFDAHTGEFTVSWHYFFLCFSVSFLSVTSLPEIPVISVTQQIFSWKNSSPFMELYLLYVFRMSVDNVIIIIIIYTFV